MSKLYLIGTDVIGAMAPRNASWSEVASPTQVTLSPRGAGSTVYGDVLRGIPSGVSRVVIQGGNYWKPDPAFEANANAWNDSTGSPPTATVYFLNGSKQVFSKLQSIDIRGGTLRNFTRIFSGARAFAPRVVGESSEFVRALDEVLGAEATDAFFAAKAEVDTVLAKADSSWNLVQHGAVKPFLDQEAKIVEGFRTGVDKKDSKLVDDATGAMKQLAALARQHFINTTDGSVKSQTKEAATDLLSNAGGDLEKFKSGLGDTLTLLKWVGIIAAALGLLVVGGIYVVPFVAGRRR